MSLSSNSPNAQTLVVESIHRLRAPLYALKLAQSSLLQPENENLTEAQRILLVECQNRITQMFTYVDDIAILADISHHVKSQELILCEVKSIVDSVINDCNLMMLAKRIHFEINDIAPTLMVMGDPKLLKIALLNIMDNAFKYSSEGATVLLKVSEQEDIIHIAVTDSGIGVPNDEVSKLFTLYSRLSNAQKNDIPGSGLGLWIARSILSAHHGTITYKAHDTVGSVFTLSLPKNLRV